MSRYIERITVEAVAALIAISALAGGVGLVGGGLVFPADWLIGTPFADYRVPGLLLGAIVGGSALFASALLLARHKWAVPVALGAGLIQVGWIVGELVLVGTRDPLMGMLQAIYFGAGTLVAVIAADLWHRSSLAPGQRVY